MNTVNITKHESEKLVLLSLRNVTNNRNIIESCAFKSGALHSPIRKE